MPFQKNGKRDYKREDAWDKAHQGREADRVARNKARRELSAEGLVHKGDGKDVDHAQPLSKGGSESRSNLRVVDASTNRSFKRNSQSELVSQTSTKEASGHPPGKARRR